MTVNEESCLAIIQEYYSHGAQHVQETFQVCRQSLNKKNIHNLRLALKNYKAFCSLFDSIQRRKPQSPSFTVPLEDLFKRLGDLRDLQVSIKLFDELTGEFDIPVKKLRKKILSCKKNRKDGLADFLKEFDPTQDLKKISDRVGRFAAKNQPDSFLQAAILKFIAETVDQIRVLMNLRHSVRVLHGIRTQVKSLYYILLVFRNETWFSQRYPGIQPELLNHLQLEMGYWHDMVVLKDLIRDVKRKERKNIRAWKLMLLEDALQKKQALSVKSITREINQHLMVFSQDEA